METKNFLGLDGLNHFWEKAKVWIINEISTKIAGIVLSSVPTGTVLSGLYTTAPDGFLLCDGKAYLKTTYPELFAIINTFFNYLTDSDDNIFRVPDLRNRTVMGANPKSNQTTGNISNVGDVQLAQLPTIKGYVDHKASNAFPFGAADGAFYLRRSGKNNWYDHSGTGYNFGFDASNANASIDHEGNNVYVNYGEVRSANIRMNYIIKY